MGKSEIRNPRSEIFLGVDGGQSHTEAVIADASGKVLARGFGGASNHAEQPGGRERLRNAVIDSVSGALKESQLDFVISQRFKSAHFGMTGGADFKQEIIGAIINAEFLTVGHDAPTALCGATGGKTGIVVIAGTGSVVYGENESGETTQIGGLGFLFSDEGSGFWLAAQTIRLAIKEQDGIIEDNGLENTVLKFFNVSKIRDLTTAVYNGKVSRDRIAALAETAAEAAENGNRILEEQISCGAEFLAEGVKSAAHRLHFDGKFSVAGVGGMFQGKLMNEYFTASLAEKAPQAEIVKPRFGAAIGALLLAYKQADVEINERFLANLENSQSR